MMKRQKGGKGLIYLSILMVSIFGSQFVQAQEYPTKPVTLVIPFGAGGSHDLTARAVTSVAADYLGQPMIVQLKPGGGGAIAAEFVAKAAPDGYTLLFGGSGPNTTLPAIEARSKGPDDFVAVCRVNYSPAVIVARPDAPRRLKRCWHGLDPIPGNSSSEIQGLGEQKIFPGR